VGEPANLIDPFSRGVAAGALLIFAVAVLRGGAGSRAKGVTVACAISLAAWLITESPALWDSFDRSSLLLLPAYLVAGLFWLFIVAVFEDRPLRWTDLGPAALMGVSGVIMGPGPPPLDPLWIARNVMAGLLCLHAGVVVAKGWRGDLLEARRGLRGPLLGLTALFGIFQTVNAFVLRADPEGPWLGLTVGEPYGGAILAAMVLAITALFVQAAPGLFEQRRAAGLPDGRIEAADRLLLEKINGLMAAEIWRREGLTIGQLAAELGEGEHRVRRLINQRLGHRNFAEFINAHRVAAAKRRLADPTQARTTIAVIAFDLGYGSLGPFNRAFLAVTGATPTRWRSEALRASLDIAKVG
jgi:AraC-like DNA-binding protein